MLRKHCTTATDTATDTATATATIVIKYYEETSQLMMQIWSITFIFKVLP